MPCCPFRAEQLLFGYKALKRFRQGRVGRSRVQKGHRRQGQSSAPFETQTAEQHVLSRLGSSVGVPSTAAVVADAADSGAQTGEMKGSVSSQNGLH